MTGDTWTARRFRKVRDSLIQKGILRKQGWGPWVRLELTELGRELAKIQALERPESAADSTISDPEVYHDSADPPGRSGKSQDPESPLQPSPDAIGWPRRGEMGKIRLEEGAP